MKTWMKNKKDQLARRLAALFGRRKKNGDGEEKPKLKRKIRPRVLITGVVILALIVFFVIPKLMNRSKAASAKAEGEKTATVERRSITSELSSSGTISPKDTYEITSLVEGDVIGADFEEGDQVEKDQVLYQIDVSSMDSQLKAASNSLERSQNSYEEALADYNDALSDYSGNTYKATEAGYIKTLYIKEGDKISNGTKIADIYDDRVMKLKLPFLSVDAVGIGVGNEAVVTLTDTEEQVSGIVTEVSNMDTTLTGGRIIRYVTVQVNNPGGLTTEYAATAAVGGYVSSMEANFEPVTETVMNADLAVSVEVQTLVAHEGDYVTKDTPLFLMESKTAEKLMRNYKDALDKAEENVESAQNKLDTTQDSYDNYTITAPISGQVISKTAKLGDKVSKNSNGSTTLAVIYDLSAYTFEMSIDELDIKNVKVGQTVEVTADALEGQTLTGKVTNISLESSYSNGVTNYPVTVTMDETGDLLPGMNVDGRIILEEANDVLTIPVDALMRGNRVYIKDASEKEAKGSVPAGFKAVEVETGLVNDDYVEIKSGLNEGDEVYVSASSVSKNNTMQGMPGMQMGGPGGGGGYSGGGGNRSGGGGYSGGGNRSGGGAPGGR